MVDRNIEEPLQLAGMKIQCHDSICTCQGNKVGNELGSNRFTASCFAIGTSIAVIRNNGINRTCAGTTQSIHHDHQFHKVFVNRIRNWLDDEYVITTHAFIDINLNLAVAKVLDGCIAKFNAHFFSNLFSQFLIWIKREKLDSSIFLHVFHTSSIYWNLLSAQTFSSDRIFSCALTKLLYHAKMRICVSTLNFVKELSENYEVSPPSLL